MAPEPLQALLSGAVRCVEYSGGNVYVDAPRGRNRVYLPGSFNPLHEGHRAMLDAAVGLAGPDAQGCFELTVKNADKVGCGLFEGAHACVGAEIVQQPSHPTGTSCLLRCVVCCRSLCMYVNT